MAAPSSMAIARSLSGLRATGGLTGANLGIDISFSPTVAIAAKRIDKLGIDIRSFHEPLKRSVQRVMAPSFQRNFDEGGRPTWEPRSEATFEIQERFGFSSGSTLIRTGLLRRTMGQLNIWRITRNTAVITDLPQKVWYGALQQGGYSSGGFKALVNRFGGDINKALRAAERPDAARGINIPARPFAVLQDEDVVNIERTFFEWFEERVERAWPRGL